MDERYQKVLRRMRTELLRQLSTVGVDNLIGVEEFGYHFSAAEKERIRSPRVPHEQVAILLDTLTFKDRGAFEHFVFALRLYNPNLAVRLEGAERETSEGSASSMSTASASSSFSTERAAVGVVRQRQAEVCAEEEVMNRRGQESAGVYGLEGCGDGPAFHLSHLSYDRRQFLSSQLNSNPPETFSVFCSTLGVDDRMIRASLKSRDRTGYLLQEFSRQPEATLDRLEEALSCIGRRDVFEQLVVH